MSTLKVSVLVVLVLLAVAIQISDAGPYGANVGDSICCNDYLRRPLPTRLVKGFSWTSRSCRKPGVVLITIKNVGFCADPRHPWVKKLLHKLA
ncbi:C-C motif chemokine 22 [Apodemus sylvaticus]|uniref:C-C motif chemokine 22 n=1 Tax=Apodemus sylvaticus TaxID=10129 RepID=UPI0022434DF1|nr:C-C motif chemokine 22 [Apodemus sylvaticus]